MLEKLSSIFICRKMHLLWQSEIKIKAKAIACSVLNTIHLKNKKTCSNQGHSRKAES